MVHLVEAVDILMTAGILSDLSSVRTESLLQLIGRATREQLDAVVAQPKLRALVLGEFVSRIPERFRGGAPAATVHLNLVGGERIQIAIENGACRAGTDLDRAPNVTITADPVDLLKAATSKVTAIKLLASRRISARGDLRLALRVVLAFEL